jgi:pimeloyl-ACP methyl ester carboxylesterase
MTEALTTSPAGARTRAAGWSTPTVKLWFHDAAATASRFLMGGTTAGHFPFDFARPYLDDFRLVTWSRAARPSDCPDPATHPYDLDVWSADLRDLLGAVGIDRTHIWAGGFGSFMAHRFAALHPELVGALVTYNDVWSGDPAMAYDRVWNVYAAIVDNFGTTGLGARMLAGIFGVSDPPWFLDWEALNVEQVSRLETVEATTGFGCLCADVRDDLARIQAPTSCSGASRSWDGSRLDEGADHSLQLMLERVPEIETATVPDAHPAYVVMQKRPSARRSCAVPRPPSAGAGGERASHASSTIVEGSRGRVRVLSDGLKQPTGRSAAGTASTSVTGSFAARRSSTAARRTCGLEPIRHGCSSTTGSAARPRRCSASTRRASCPARRSACPTAPAS